MIEVVLLHGFLGTASSWDGVAAAMPARRLVLPGHGPAPDVSPASFEAAVDGIAARMDRPALVAGYSMGGRLALALALRHPAKVLGAIVAGASPGLGDPREREERRAWDASQAALLEREGLRAFVDRWERLPLFATQASLPPALRAAERERRLSHTEHGAAWAMRVLGLGSQPDLRDALGTCHVPLTFLAGERDEKFSAIAREAARAAPLARAEIVPGVGHNLLLEAPAAVAAAISGHVPLHLSPKEKHA